MGVLLSAPSIAQGSNTYHRGRSASSIFATRGRRDARRQRWPLRRRLLGRRLACPGITEVEVRVAVRLAAAVAGRPGHDPIPRGQRRFMHGVFAPAAG